MIEQTIGEKIDGFIAYKRKLGYVYDTQEYYLLRYKKYMEGKFPYLTLPDKESIDRFLDEFQGETGGLYNTIAVLREFSRYLIRLGDKDAYLIPPKQMPKLYPEAPYFFSEDEILIFFRTCDDYFDKNPGPLGRGLVVPAEFRLFHCCGLRTREVRLLLVENVHLQGKYIDIVQSKGPKSRRIYISDELAMYLKQYDRQISEKFPDRMFFFPRSKERAYSRAFIHYDFHLIWKLSFPEWEGELPRVYDFRHHFAWANINRWVREGKDVNAMLPYLMQYMGHSDIKHTLYYFRFVPDFYSDYEMLSKQLNDLVPEVPDE